MITLQKLPRISIAWIFSASNEVSASTRWANDAGVIKIISIIAVNNVFIFILSCLIMINKITHLKFLSYSFVLFLVAGCSAPSSSPTDVSSRPATIDESFTTGSALLDKTLAAHGGVKKWRSFASMTFKKSVKDKKTENHLIDLYNRKVLILSSSYRIGFDGKQVWLTPSLDKSPSKSPRFYHNLWFYFASIPFVFSDPGVNAEDLPPAVIGGKEYNKIKISFESAVGDSPKDQYLLYTDPNTHRVKMINYSVTYYDSTRADNYNALVYEDYVELYGLMVPGKLTGYKWQDNQLGDLRYETFISDYQFSQQQPIQEMFEIPKKQAQIYIDTLGVN